jgi:hypothetical protein
VDEEEPKERPDGLGRVEARPEEKETQEVFLFLGV